VEIKKAHFGDKKHNFRKVRNIEREKLHRFYNKTYALNKKGGFGN